MNTVDVARQGTLAAALLVELDRLRAHQHALPRSNDVAAAVSSYELVVTSDGDGDVYDDGIGGINLHGVTAIHVGFWLKTTSAPKSGEQQCADIDKCISVDTADASINE